MIEALLALAIVAPVRDDASHLDRRPMVASVRAAIIEARDHWTDAQRCVGDRIERATKAEFLRKHAAAELRLLGLLGGGSVTEVREIVRCWWGWSQKQAESLVEDMYR